jgi:L-alanine-DL-glutamate epimerase-like enolase superfamily enzyme
MLEGAALLAPGRALRLPLLTPFNAATPETIAAEVERRLDEGFATFKIKVGSDVEADLARVAMIQQAANGRASLRIDANRGYDAAAGCRFASALDPAGIELFEQPCAAEDWAANERVAAVSSVPLMLDEPICALSDIERAAGIAGVGYCKLKLKRFGGLERLRRALDRVRECGMEPVLGDGLGGEIACWMEACVAQVTIRNAGEFNGFLKSTARLFAPTIGFEAGALVMPAGFAPEIDRAALAAHETRRERFAPALA